MRPLLSLLLLAGSSFAQAQSTDYSSYRTGAATNKTVQPQGGVCMMGGGAEVDSAMKWFLKRANGGDVLVLRATGADGYNSYMFTDLGVTLNSVETIVCKNANASNSAYVQQRITEAEAIWFAGGDQSVYIDYWRGTPVAALINAKLKTDSLAIGGTSAGMAILGRRYFSAKNGTVTSADALANPLAATVTVDTASFLQVPYLENTITDTHFDNPERKGRAVVFLARTNFYSSIFNFDNLVALDERTAITIDAAGYARIWGGSATGNDDNAYFMRPNCKNIRPEMLTTGTPLTWNAGQEALQVYHLKGNKGGTGTFSLKLSGIAIPLRSWLDGQQAAGGAWQNWWVQGGTLNIQDSAKAPNCLVGIADVPAGFSFEIKPNPTQNYVLVSAPAGILKSGHLLNLTGQVLGAGVLEGASLRFQMAHLPAGVYLLQFIGKEGVQWGRVVKE